MELFLYYIQYMYINSTFIQILVPDFICKGNMCWLFHTARHTCTWIHYNMWTQLIYTSQMWNRVSYQHQSLWSQWLENYTTCERNCNLHFLQTSTLQYLYCAEWRKILIRYSVNTEMGLYQPAQRNCFDFGIFKYTIDFQAYHTNSP